MLNLSVRPPDSSRLPRQALLYPKSQLPQVSHLTIVLVPIVVIPLKMETMFLNRRKDQTRALNTILILLNISSTTGLNCRTALFVRKVSYNGHRPRLEVLTSVRDLITHTRDALVTTSSLILTMKNSSCQNGKVTNAV